MFSDVASRLKAKFPFVFVGVKKLITNKNVLTLIMKVLDRYLRFKIEPQRQKGTFGHVRPANIAKGTFPLLTAHFAAC